MKKCVLTMRGRETLNGYIYTLPWMLGFAAFFLTSVIQNLTLSFYNVDKITLTRTFAGFSNFTYAFTGDLEFPALLREALTSILTQTPLILIFSYFVALLLKKNFKGSFIVKAIFFLTVILSSDLFASMQADNSTLDAAQMSGVMSESSQLFQVLSTDNLTNKLLAFGIPFSLVDFVVGAINNISTIMLNSGIQIFIFLAGINSISESVYEAAKIEGATAWECFWKVTFPISGPIIMVNLVYTIIDSFNTQLSPALQYIHAKSFEQFNYGYGAALSNIYFLVISGTLAFMFLLFRKKVFYQS